MLVSLDWISEFVNVPMDLSPDELASRLTLATAEVESVTSTGAYWKEIKVVEITSIEPHPEADKLNLVTFKLSEDKSFRVVCGASNVRIGLKTPFAPIGTTLPVGFMLEPKKIRGILSEGMLCSEEELGLADTSKGIMELPAETPLGISLEKLWDKKSDIVFDIDNKSLTHRPDLWGHFGFAREFSAIFENDLCDKFTSAWQKNLESMISEGESPLKVKVENGSSCLGYFGLSMDNVVVGDSPLWIKNRLEAAGIRSINNIVDISNYVMLELGHPLHIFDRDKIKGDCLFIHALKSDQYFTTLDEEKRSLKKGDTVISDDNGALVVAGIMGGLSSSVDESTKNIFIEVANWKAATTRSTSTHLGLRTDSSSRFEKTLDTLQCKKTLLRTFELVKDLCPEAKSIGSIEKSGVEEASKDLIISISLDEVVKTLGKAIEASQLTSILTRLAFKVDNNKDNFDILVPSFRATKDISNKADIIEEIGRIIGYDNIEPSMPMLGISPVRLNPAHRFKRAAQDFFVSQAQAFEVNTYPMIGDKLLEKTKWKAQSGELRLLNSLSKEQEIMRDSMIPSLLETAALNCKNFDHGRFFELGRSYVKDDKNFASERLQLAVCFFSKYENPFMDLYNTVLKATRFLNIPCDFSDRHPKFKNNVLDESWVGLHPFEFKNIRIMGKMNGVLHSVHPMLLRKMKVKGLVAIAVIDYTDLVKKEMKEKVSYRPLNVYPGSRFDFTVSLEKSRSSSEIFNALEKCKIRELKDYGIVDIFSPEGEMNHITVTSYFEDSQKTLEGEFLKNCEGKLIDSLEKSNIFLKS